MNRERIVIDTNVLISALLNPNGTPRRVVDTVVESCILLESEACLKELETRLAKRKFQKYLSITDRSMFMTFLRNHSQLITVKHCTEICSDSDDNKFLELSVSGQGKYLITGDKDLLVIGEYEGIKILTPSQFLDLNFP